jgi:outer membrane protein assembly factor BamB
MATGVAPLADPPQEWSKSTNIRWKIPIPGRGSATPIIWGDHIFILTAVELVDRPAPDADQRPPRADQLTPPPAHPYQFQVLDVSRLTGQVRWQRTVCEALPPEGHHPTNTYASASPITDGRFVYASFGSHGIYCFDFDGNLKWSRDLGEMRTRHGWGEGASPALLGDLLIVNRDHEEQSALLALDTQTGKTRWQVARDEPTSWSTPLVLDDRRPPQVIVSATRRVRSYNGRTGELLWECGGLTTNVIPSPVASHDTVFCMSWYGDSAVMALPLDKRGDLTGGPDVRWTYDRLAPYCPSPLLLPDGLYFLRGNSAILAGLDPHSGRTTLPPTRLGLSADVYASPVAADGRIFIVDRSGTTVVLRPDEDPEVLAVNRLDEPVDASPALVGKQLFLRTHYHLYCLEELD